VHRQLGALAPGGGAVAPVRHCPGGVGRNPHHLPLRRLRPRHISQAQLDGDLIVTVCDLAREELGPLAAVHWSVPDPVPAGDPASFDAALAELGQRIQQLAPSLTAAP
jgi:protein-tyrosine-phosphatase